MAPHWIDEERFSLRELLQLTGIGRGTAEGYMKRGIVAPAAGETGGKGYHRGYTGRDILKFSAVAYMSKAGISPGWVKDFVASEVETNFRTHEKGRGYFDLVIDDYAANGMASQYRYRSPYVFNAVIFRLAPVLRNAMQSFEFIERMATALRERDTVTYLAFDAWVFVREGFTLLESYLKQQSKE